MPERAWLVVVRNDRTTVEEIPPAAIPYARGHVDGDPVVEAYGAPAQTAPAALGELIDIASGNV